MVSLSINIAGRAYPIKVEAEDEAEEIQHVVSDINEKIQTFQKTYAKVDKQDTLAMTLLTYLLDTKKNRHAPVAIPAPAVVETLPITALNTNSQTDTFPDEVVDQLLDLDAYLDKLLEKKLVPSPL